jgi:hypothetical protein
VSSQSQSTCAARLRPCWPSLGRLLRMCMLAQVMMKALVQASFTSNCVQQRPLQAP